MSRTGSKARPRASWLARAARPDLWRLALAALVGSTAHACALALAGAAAWLIARAAEQPGAMYVAVAIAAVRAFGVGRGVLRYVERLLGADIGFRVMGRTRIRVYVDLERSGPVGAGRLRGGDMLTRVVGDVEAIQDLLVRGVLPIAVATLTGVATVVVFAMVLPAAAVVLAIGLLIAGVGGRALALVSARRAESRLAPARDELAAPVVELLDGTADLQAYRATGRWLNRIRERDATLTGVARQTATGAGLEAGLSVLAIGLTVVLELIVGIAAARSGAVSTLWVPVFALVPLSVFEVTAMLPAAVHAVLRGLEAAGRLQGLEELPRPPASGGTVGLPSGPLRMEVDDISVRWPGNAEPTLRGVTLSMRPGWRIGVVGESGAGKTTLVNALLGFLPAAEGSIRLDGTELADIDEDALRRAVSVCAQDAHLFDTTIRENLLIARPDATPEELAEALQKARLWDWVDQLPQGLDTPVGDRGVRLSGGERQRLALSRALLADPAVLLLDEPTAHLDEPTAAALMRDLLVATHGRTTLLVTHRLAGLSVVDEILVLADGGVVQQGTPTELMEAPGPYRKMWFRSASSASSLTGLAVTRPGGVPE